MKAQTKQQTVRITAHIPANIKELFAMAATLEGQTQTDFLIKAVAEAARRTIAEHSIPLGTTGLFLHPLPVTHSIALKTIPPQQQTLLRGYLVFPQL